MAIELIHIKIITWGSRGACDPANPPLDNVFSGATQASYAVALALTLALLLANSADRAKTLHTI